VDVWWPAPEVRLRAARLVSESVRSTAAIARWAIRQAEQLNIFHRRSTGALGSATARFWPAQCRRNAGPISRPVYAMKCRWAECVRDTEAAVRR
jgi:hypothetical protein